VKIDSIKQGSQKEDESQSRIYSQSTALRAWEIGQILDRYNY